MNSPGGTRHHALPQKCYFCFSQTIIVIPLFPAAHGAAFFLRPATGRCSSCDLIPAF
ncbi:hypothetical protein C6555_27920 [Escherichia coli]|uniref:Uncharacterized protein n=1 Tax=Escherichia coli O145:NM TaxID=991919 RepID=A0A4P8C040_ECOLX|nr:hypothetical protein I3Y_15100 [Escherichia coli O145 str. RM9872]EEW3619755.1 hypothetical protein [Escherichia coli]QCH93116.1 hypothetical protein CCU01_009680 [Escherichia coli O145:NM]EFN9791627.1 hypothetical protein [Escherichia coli]EFO1938957.1 hypothetical protein [Escherichia coli]